MISLIIDVVNVQGGDELRESTADKTHDLEVINVKSFRHVHLADVRRVIE